MRHKRCINYRRSSNALRCAHHVAEFRGDLQCSLRGQSIESWIDAGAPGDEEPIRAGSKTALKLIESLDFDLDDESTHQARDSS
jgi:hypothetical protein